MQAIEQAVKSNADLRRERIAIDVADAQLEASRGAFDFLLTSNLTFSRRTTPAINSQDVQGGVNNNLALDLGLARAARDRRRASASTCATTRATPTTGCSAGPWPAPPPTARSTAAAVEPQLQPPPAARLRLGHRPGQHPPPARPEGPGPAQPADAGGQRDPRRDQHLLGPVLRHPGPGHPPLGGRSGPASSCG